MFVLFLEPGYITRSEFKKLFKDRQADVDAQIEEITKAFRVFDKDNSGTISAEEIKAVLSKCGEKLDEAEVDEMIKRADLDGDGLISYEGRLCLLNSSEIGTHLLRP